MLSSPLVSTRTPKFWEWSCTILGPFNPQILGDHPSKKFWGASYDIITPDVKFWGSFYNNFGEVTPPNFGVPHDSGDVTPPILGGGVTPPNF